MTIKKRKLFNFFGIYYNPSENLNIPYFQPQWSDIEALGYPHGCQITNLVSNNQKELEDILTTVDEKLLSFFYELTKNNFSKFNLIKVKEIKTYPTGYIYIVYLNCPFLHLEFLNFSEKEDAERFSVNLNIFLLSCLNDFLERNN